MRRELLVPKLGLTMEEGTLIEWLVVPGEQFGADQSLFVIESEKAAVEVPADAPGRLLEAITPGPQALPVGTVIGYWDDGEEERASDAGAPRASIAASKQQPTGALSLAALPAAPVPALPVIGDGERIPVTPLARRLAQQRGIDLGQVRGSGPRGRIRVRDLPDAANAKPAPVSGDHTPAGRLRPLSSLEQTIARRMVQSKRDIPHFYLSLEAEVSALLQLREQLRAAFPARRQTFNHFLLAAVGRALLDRPDVNAVWTDEGIVTLASSDVGMAVQTERGLVAPVLRDVGTLDLPTVTERSDLAIRLAKEGRLSPREMSGGAITLSNAGMHDVTYMTSIIPPSQSMILGVGSVRELFRPDATGQPALRREVGLTLSADHRVLDGVRALDFLKQVVSYLEQPLKLVLP